MINAYRRIREVYFHISIPYIERIYIQPTNNNVYWAYIYARHNVIHLVWVVKAETGKNYFAGN